MKRHINLPSERRGSVMIMASFAAIFMIGLTALVTDVGWMYFQNARIQTAVNAGWKAGYDRMTQICAENNISPTALNTAQRTEVNNMVVAVTNLNLASDKQIPAGTLLVTQWDPFTVRGTTNEGLFFARVINFNDITVAAQRQAADRLSDMSIIPLTIPFGVVKDLTKNTYSYDPFSTLGQDGFIASQEYILKLGSGVGKPVTPDNVKRILVPMDAGAQTNAGFLKAYGAAYWCLKSGGSDAGYTPVEWLMGYRGGSFFLPHDPAVIAKLAAMGVNYTEIIGNDAVQAIFDQVNPNVIELFNRPVVAVYSSQGDPDAVEVVLRAAEIPYGNYHPARTAAFDANQCTRLYDSEILDGALDNFNWLHMHHEDFTGWTGGCETLENTCYTKEASLNKTDRTQTQLCTYCRNYYFGWSSARNAWTTDANSWGSPSGSNRTRNISFTSPTQTITLTWVPTQCENHSIRCAEKSSYTGTRWWDINNALLCEDGAERPMCQSAKAAHTTATTRGYTDDAGYDRKRKWLSGSGTMVKADGSNPLPMDTDFVRKPNRVQKMKFDVVNKIRQHIEVGGYMYAQCFAPETLDMAIYQRKIFTEQPNNVTNTSAFADCFAFTGFAYKAFCYKPSSVSMYYSTINANVYGPFTTDFPLDPRCQNHTGNTPNFKNGHCDAFPKARIKNGVTVLGDLDSNSTVAQYIKGTFGTGQFCFAGGHYHDNIQSQRLVANNILLGALSSKDITSGTDTDVSGRQKNNYGVVDPDNVTAGGANDYRDRFMNGFNQSLTLGDRLMGESGNMAGPTDESVAFRTDSTATYSRRFVIVPIHDVPPEVPINNSHNATSTAIYDLQGTDHPNGVYVPTGQPGGYAFGSSVRIIGFAKFEILNPDEYARAGGNVVNGDAGDLGYYQTGQVRGKFIEYIIKPGEISVPY